MNKLMQLGWGPWGYGLIRGAISGGATAVASSPVVMGLDPDHFNLQNGLPHTLELMAAIFVINAIYRMIEFLKDHPLPEVVSQ